MRNQPSTRKQEHEIKKTSVLRIGTLTNSNPMTLRVFFGGVDNRKRHIYALIRYLSRAV